MPGSAIATIPWHQPLINMLNFINRKLADGKICFVSLLLLAAGALTAPLPLLFGGGVGVLAGGRGHVGAVALY